MERQSQNAQFDQYHVKWGLENDKESLQLFSPRGQQNNQNTQKSDNTPFLKNSETLSTDASSKVEWTKDQEFILISKHQQVGNRWALISQFLKKKNDNCVKNHFYSRLRKVLRKLNRIIVSHFKRSLKIISTATIYKLVQASEQRFKQNPACSHEVSLQSQNAITKMLHLSVKEEFINEQVPTNEFKKINQYKGIIEQIYWANRSYKKKSKKIKNSTIKAPIRTKRNNKNKQKPGQIDDNYLAEQSQSVSENLLEILDVAETIKFNQDQQKKQKIILSSQSIIDHQNPTTIHGKKVQMKEGDQMQQMLKNIGILKQGKLQKIQHRETSEHGDLMMESFSDMQNQSQAFSFMDDSFNCWGNKDKMFTHINQKLFGRSQL